MDEDRGIHYTLAAVCRRGHVAAADMERRPPTQKCPKCGADVLSRCPACDSAIRGALKVPRVAIDSRGYEPGDFCTVCAAPFPWASRQARLWEVENRLDADDSLTDGERLELHEQLEALREQLEEMDDSEQAERWQRIKKLAPVTWPQVQTIVTTVTTAAIQRKLGL